MATLSPYVNGIDSSIGRGGIATRRPRQDPGAGDAGRAPGMTAGPRLW